jgi:hypothetical protein
MLMDNALLWQKAKLDLSFFTTRMLGLKYPKHYSEWEDVVENNPRSLIESPRGSWKSYFFALAYPLWKILQGKTEVLMVSDSEDQARKNLRTMRQAIESREELAPMRPTTKELWGTDQVSFPNGSLVTIMGFGTSRRGLHPDIIIPDDIESESGKMSREDRNRMYFGVISGMATPKTKIAAVGTPLEFGDILQQLSQNKSYKYWRRPALIDGKNQFPDIWTDDWLKFRREEMGSINFAREMLLERIDPETQPFKAQFYVPYSEVPLNFSRKVTVVDPAYTEKDGDATAIVTVGFTHGNHAYVLEAKEVRRENPGAIVTEIFRTIDAHKPDAVGIERRAGEIVSFSFDEQRIRGNRWDFQYVELSHGGVSKGSRVRMVGGLVPRWEARTVHIHKNDTNLLDQLYKFRLDDSGRGHDDLVDALAYCFHPDMIQPGGYKRPDPSRTTQRARPLYRVGNSTFIQGPDKFEPLWKRLDRRISDQVAA